jgi:glycine dehydrogenase subunit 2
MLTNPNTCGLFERDIREIADLIHEAGGYFYCDGANFNAIVGRVRPGDLGVDAMHINLHKTFPRPMAAAVPALARPCFSDALAKYAPLPFVNQGAATAGRMVEDEADAKAQGAEPFGRMVAFHGQMGMFTRA